MVEGRPAGAARQGPAFAEAIVCYGGCTSGSLELRANIVRVSGTGSRTGWVDAGSSNTNCNVFFPSYPTQLVRGPFDVVADPKYVSVSSSNLLLVDRSSPAVDRGCTVYSTYDRDGQKVPVDIVGLDNGPSCAGEPDAGAHELQS